jgi:hypothetical protein
MKTTTEMQLRNVALILTAIVLLQWVWGGARLLLTGEPEPTLPAEASLQVEEIRQGTQLSEEMSQSLAVSPIFWLGREKFVPNRGGNAAPEAKAPRNSNIDDVALHGTYSAGDKSGVIISYKNERRRLQRDEEVAGWTFTLLGEEGAVFESGEQTQVLALEHAKSVPMPKRASKPEPAAEDEEKDGKGDKKRNSAKQHETNKQHETGE